MPNAISLEDFIDFIQADTPPQVIDVRRHGAFEKHPLLIPGAVKRGHENIAAWAGALDKAREVVVYCVFGHEVSQNAASELEALGFSARYLEGGIDAWENAGGSVQPL